MQQGTQDLRIFKQAVFLKKQYSTLDNQTQSSPKCTLDCRNHLTFPKQITFKENRNDISEKYFLRI